MLEEYVMLPITWDQRLGSKVYIGKRRKLTAIARIGPRCLLDVLQDLRYPNITVERFALFQYIVLEQRP